MVLKVINQRQRMLKEAALPTQIELLCRSRKRFLQNDLADAIDSDEYELQAERQAYIRQQAEPQPASVEPIEAEQTVVEQTEPADHTDTPFDAPLPENTCSESLPTTEAPSEPNAGPPSPILPDQPTDPAIPLAAPYQTRAFPAAAQLLIWLLLFFPSFFINSTTHSASARQTCEAETQVAGTVSSSSYDAQATKPPAPVPQHQAAAAKPASQLARTSTEHFLLTHAAPTTCAAIFFDNTRNGFP
jgi:hypothetical protein